MFAGIKAIEHIYLERFWVKNINTDIQEAQGILSRMKSKRPTLKHIIIKMRKDNAQRKILKASREK